MNGSIWRYCTGMSNWVSVEDYCNFSLIFNQFLKAMWKFALCRKVALEYCIVGTGRWWCGFPCGFIGTVMTIPEFRLLTQGARKDNIQRNILKICWTIFWFFSPYWEEKYGVNILNNKSKVTLNTDTIFFWKLSWKYFESYFEYFWKKYCKNILIFYGWINKIFFYIFIAYFLWK